MSKDKIIVEYIAETGGIKKQLGDLEKGFEGVEKSSKKSQKEVEKAAKEAEKALQKEAKEAEKTALAYERAQQQKEKAAQKAALVAQKETENVAKATQQQLNTVEQSAQRIQKSSGILQNSVNQLTRELPAFTFSAQTGFLAISNNLPILGDAIGRIKAENLELAASGKETTSVFKQLAGAFFSLNTLFSVGILLTTVFGKEIGAFIKELFSADDGVKEYSSTLEGLNQKMKDVTESIDEQYRFQLKLTEARGQDTFAIKEKIAIEKLSAAYRETLTIKNEIFNLERKIDEKADQENRDLIGETLLNKQLAKRKDLLKESQKIEQVYLEDLKILYAKYYTDKSKDEKKAKDDTEKNLADLQKIIEDYQVNNIKAEQARELAKQKLSFRREKESLKEKYSEYDQYMKAVALIEESNQQEVEKIKEKYRKKSFDVMVNDTMAKIDYEKKTTELRKRLEKESSDYIIKSQKDLDKELKSLVSDRNSRQEQAIINNENRRIYLLKEGVNKQIEIEEERYRKAIEIGKKNGEDRELIEEEHQKRLNEIRYKYMKDYTVMFLDATSRLMSLVAENERKNIQANLDLTIQRYDRELALLDERNRRDEDGVDRRTAKERAYEKERKRIEDEKNKAIRKAKKEEFDLDKANNIARTLMEGARAVMAAGGITPMALLVGFATAAQVAIIASQSNPYFKGTNYVDKENKYRDGIDTVPALLTKGERVITVEDNKKNWELYEATRKNKLTEYINHKYILPAMKSQKRQYDKGMINVTGNDFSDANIVKELKATRMVSQRNTFELAKVIKSSKPKAWEA
jgi:hypothetical protein